MSLPKKKRGFRKISVEGNEFNWRFNSHIEVCPVARKNNKLIVDFGWFDPFLYVNDKLNSPTTYTPEIVTPAFVRKAIEFALKHNWDIMEKTAVTKVVYRDNVFNIISPT